MERQREGIAAAKRAGKYRGRKAALTPTQATELSARLDGGESASALAREYGVSRATVLQHPHAGGDRVTEHRIEFHCEHCVSIFRGPRAINALIKHERQLHQ